MAAKTIQEVAARFIELCNQGKNFDAMRTLYAPGIVSVEGDGSETVGQTPVIQKSERWIEGKTLSGQVIRGPYFNGPSQFAVHFVHEVTLKASGKRIALEEVGVYTVENGLITREQFFFAGER